MSTREPEALAEVFARRGLLRELMQQIKGREGPPAARPSFAAEPEPPDEARARKLLRWMPAAFRELDGESVVRFVAGGPDRVDAARRAFVDAAKRRGPAWRGSVVLRGPAGAGKTALACAWLRSRILAGVERARFVPEMQLGTDREMGDGRVVSWEDLAISATDLVLDDLGARLSGAPEGGGLAAMRVEAASRVIHARYDRDRPHVITTPHDREALARVYGDGVARRVYEGAAVVELGATRSKAGKP